MNWFKAFWKGFTTPMSHEGVRSSEPMDNFTPRAQQVLALARREADRFHHNFVGTEHLLLGLIRLGHGTAVAVLRKMGLDLEIVRMEVEKQVGTGPDEKMVGNIPYTPRVKKVLALAAKESRALNHNYVGTEHILLGILREADGVAARVLRNLDVDVEQTRQAILNELDPNFKESSVEYVVAEEESKKKQDDMIDISKRYDVYCKEGSEAVVYRNVLFKGMKKLFQVERYSIFTEYVEVEQADGKTIFFSRASIIKFCEHGVTPGAESVEGKKE
jgi:ATP-dependent Clp protease ATP-binding subunit ClpA